MLFKRSSLRHKGAMASRILGILGGSGFYSLPGLSEIREIEVDTPFGPPSDALRLGFLDGQAVVFLARHGKGHRLSPSDINYRANIWAMKKLGVSCIVSLSACGSLDAEVPPGYFVLVDQFIDRTFARKKSFFGEGLVAHVSLAKPVCSELRSLLARAMTQIGQPFKDGGTYLAMEGPQFSTYAESQLYRSWGATVVGMTNMPEAKLAREAEICYATVAMVTDFDCWHPEHDAVEVSTVIAMSKQNSEQAQKLVLALAPMLKATDEPCHSGCHTALNYALVTAKNERDPKLVQALEPILARVLAGDA